MKLTDKELQELLIKNPNNAKLQGLKSSPKKITKKKSKPKKKTAMQKKQDDLSPLGFAKTAGSALSQLGGKPRDTVKHITGFTATMPGTRGKYSRNGLRSEFTARGPVAKSSGMPMLDEHWKTQTEARGDIRIGKPISKGSLSTRGRELPNYSEVSDHVGGDPILPSVKKFKKIGWF